MGKCFFRILIAVVFSFQRLMISEAVRFTVADAEKNRSKLRALVAAGIPSMPTMTKIKLVADIFEESYRLQAEVDDLVSAAEGFDRLIRARRGEPWPEFVRSEDGSTCAREVGNWDWDLNSCARNFLDKNNGTTWFFADRASDNVAATKTGVYVVPSVWGPDPLSIETRGCFGLTAVHKLDHDQEQLQYLVARGYLSAEFSALAKAYLEVQSSIVDEIMASPWHDPQDLDRSQYYLMRASQFAHLRGTYNSLLYVPSDPAESKQSSHPTGFRKALNPNLDWDAIEEEYLSQEIPLLWFDGFLLPEALQGILDFCREATVFFDVKPGYLGAYFNEGLTSPWLLQLAQELQERLPRILRGMALVNMWAYKFDSDSSMDGIKVHADSATVNLNFWVTPDQANLDPESGGLVVYPKVPPNRGIGQDQPEGNVDGTLWNNWSKESFVKAWLKEEGVLDLAVTIPYRQNRVVMFDSRLLHETDRFHFRSGYENRRINLTLLFSPVSHSTATS